MSDQLHMSFLIRTQSQNSRCVVVIYDNVRHGFVVRLCLNVGELVIVGLVFQLLRIMEISLLCGDGFQKGVQKDKYWIEKVMDEDNQNKFFQENVLGEGKDKLQSF